MCLFKLSNYMIALCSLTTWGHMFRKKRGEVYVKETKGFRIPSRTHSSEKSRTWSEFLVYRDISYVKRMELLLSNIPIWFPCILWQKVEESLVLTGWLGSWCKGGGRLVNRRCELWECGSSSKYITSITPCPADRGVCPSVLSSADLLSFKFGRATLLFYPYLECIR